MYKEGECFGTVVENEDASALLAEHAESNNFIKHESLKAKERTGLIILDQENFNKILQRAQE